MTSVNKHLPYNVYYLPILLLSFVGMLNALYLSYSHYQNYTDPAYASFCAISKAINCDTVAQSPWSVMFGVPVALWGLIGYFIFSLLLIPLRKPAKACLPLWSLVVVCGAGYALSAIFFGYISASKIHSYCILCLLTYGINLWLFFGSWLIRRRFSTTSLASEIATSIRLIMKTRWLAGALGLMLMVVILLIVMLPPYWNFSPTPVSDDIPHGFTEDGLPWIGAENPKLTIYEFSDYMCFQCKKMHFILRQLVQLYPTQIRLVHRHFPMDNQYNPLVTEKYHSGTGKMSIIALYASIKGQFWQVNDLLFQIASQKQDFNTRTIAKVMGVPVGELSAALNDKYLRLRLKQDIAIGIDKGITGTPSFIIDGQVYMGTVPRGVLEKILSLDGK